MWLCSSSCPPSFAADPSRFHFKADLQCLKVAIEIGEGLAALDISVDEGNRLKRKRAEEGENVSESLGGGDGKVGNVSVSASGASV